jgi:predicted NBD/HSP70 family sugar kinase
MAKQSEKIDSPGHGAVELANVYVEAYGDDVRGKDGYFGDLVSKSAFQALVKDIRENLRNGAGDPIENEPDDISRSRIDKILKEGDPQSVGVVLTSVEQFSQNIAHVIKSLLKIRTWNGVERIVVGGGFRGSRVGEFAIGRAAVLAREIDPNLEVIPIRGDPDEAGIVGAVQLFGPKVLEGAERIIGVDIGGSNFRCGLVELHMQEDKKLKKAEVVGHQIWRHADEELTLDASMRRLGDMLRESIKYAEKKGLALSPLIGVGVPGTVLESGGLEGGVLNLPGDWKSPDFNLPDRICAMIPEIGGQPTQVMMHNDAVVQGLSEVPFMSDVTTWGVLTIGTGLGNALFRNKKGPRK